MNEIHGGGVATPLMDAESGQTPSRFRVRHSVMKGVEMENNKTAYGDFPFELMHGRVRAFFSSLTNEFREYEVENELTDDQRIYLIEAGGKLLIADVESTRLLELFQSDRKLLQKVDKLLSKIIEAAMLGGMNISRSCTIEEELMGIKRTDHLSKLKASRTKGADVKAEACQINNELLALGDSSKAERAKQIAEKLNQRGHKVSASTIRCHWMREWDSDDQS
ncbi:MAG: hypothetical protein KDA78_19225 [Planctomycetaceae bacterium]|nr:hypothetical protein [Planctomycetaceae bacterium]